MKRDGEALGHVLPQIYSCPQILQGTIAAGLGPPQQVAWPLLTPGQELLLLGNWLRKPDQRVDSRARG